MSHFSLKSLAFYGTAIGSVVLLFNGVSAYGNANAKAPPKIDGYYRLSAQNLPDCLRSHSLFVIIQQSGVYLNGFLHSADNVTQLAKVTEDRPSLTGRIKNSQLSLVGSVPLTSICHNSTQKVTAGQPLSVKIQGVVQGEKLTGQIALSSTQTPTEFTAQREASPEKEKE